METIDRGEWLAWGRENLSEVEYERMRVAVEADRAQQISLRAWIEACRELGRGNLKEATQNGSVALEYALDILDRTLDNVLSKAS